MKKQASPNSSIYGARAILEAIDAGRDIDKILIRQGIDTGLRKDVSDRAKSAGIPLQTVPVEKLERMARGANHQGVVALVALIPFVDAEELIISIQEKGEEALLVVLDEVSDVRNFGAIARTAECMGAHGLVIAQHGAARINGDAIKVSAGALNHLPVARVLHLQDLIYMAQSYGLKIVACTEKAEQTIFEADLRGPVCLIMGSEDRGINPRLLKSSDVQAKIPITGKIASLNVSVATGMVVLETVRQRGLPAD